MRLSAVSSRLFSHRRNFFLPSICDPRFFLLWASSLGIVALPAAEMRGAVATFTPVSGDYATAGNWSTVAIPGNGNNDEPRIGVSATQAATYSTATGYTTTSRFLIGFLAGGNGTLTLQGSAGALTFGGNNFTSANYVGVDNGTGVLTMNSGTITLTGAAGLNIGCNAAASNGTVTINSGTINVGSRLLAAANNAGAVAVVTLNGGTLNVGTGGAPSIGGNQNGVYRVGSGTSTLNLDAGTLSLYLFQSDSGTAANTVINFNGATVKALADTTQFFTNSAGAGLGLYTVNVKSGGAIFDTDGKNITAAAAFLNSGGGGLTKTGGGTLTLSSGVSSYTGNILVSQGILNAAGTTGGIAPTTGSLGNSQTVGRTITIDSGGTLRFSHNDILGNVASTANVQVVINAGGLVENGGFFNTLNNLALNGGELRANGGANATFPAYHLKGTVAVGGSSASTITANTSVNAFNRLQIGDNTVGGSTTFNVADSTGNASSDLMVSAQLSNGRDAGGSTDVTSGLTKTGSGTLELSGANIYTGQTDVNDGTLLITGTASNTTSGMYVNKGELLLNKTPGQNAIGGAGLNVGDNETVATGLAQAKLLAANQLPDASDLFVAVDGTFDMNGFNEEISGLRDGTGGTSGIVTSSAGAPTLTLNGNGDFAGVVSGSLALTKTDTFTPGAEQTLRGINTYTGNTNVTSGKLKLINAGSNNTIANSPVINIASGATLNVTGLAGTTDLVLASGQTLEGAGIVLGNVTAAAGSTISPGNSIESLGTGSITFDGGTYDYEIDSSASLAVGADLLYGNDNSTLTLINSPILSLTNLGVGSVPVGTKFTLIAYDGAWNGGIFAGRPDDSLIYGFAGINWWINYNDTVGSNFVADATAFGTQFVTITATTVPEPSTYALALVGLVALACRACACRRRTK